MENTEALNNTEEIIVEDANDMKNTQIVTYEYMSHKRASFIRKNIDMILSKIDCRRWEDDQAKETQKKLVLRLCNEIMGSLSGRVKRVYVQKKGYGRRTVADGEVSYASLMREIRGLICVGNYQDIDMVNCHPTILHQYVIKNNIQSFTSIKELESYVKHRDHIIDMTCDEIKQDGHKDEKLRERVKEAIKTTYMKIINGSKKVSDDIINTKNGITRINMFIEEMKKIREKILSMEINEKYLEYAHESFTEGETEYNVEGKAIAYFLQDLEDTILCSAVHWMKTNKYEIGSLIYDGFHVRNKNETIPKSILDKLSKFVFKKTGFSMQFKVKDFMNVIDLKEEELPEPYTLVTREIDAADIMIERMKNNIIKSETCYYARLFEGKNIYKKMIKNDVMEELRKGIFQVDIRKVGSKSIIEFSTSNKGATEIAKAMMTRWPINNDFEEMIEKSTKYKICFKNGYIDIRDYPRMVMHEYDDQTHTLAYIDRDYDEGYITDKHKQYVKTILSEIFGQDYDMAMRFYSIAAFGKPNFKRWCVGLGSRGTGKSQIAKLFENALGDMYVQTINVAHLIYKSNEEGDSKHNNWIIPLHSKGCRLAFSNECDFGNGSKNESKQLSSGKIKSLSSGADNINVRSLFTTGDETLKGLTIGLSLFMNADPPVSEIDVMQTCTELHFNTKFCKQEEYELFKHLNECEENETKYMLADPQRLEKINTSDEMKNALIYLLAENYGDAFIEIKRESYAQVTFKDSILAEFGESFEFTKNPDDMLLVKDVNMHITLSIDQLKRNGSLIKRDYVKYLKEKGVFEKKHNNNRMYSCIKLKPKEHDEVHVLDM